MYQSILGHEVHMTAGETARVHTTKSGKRINMVYPMSVSMSHRGVTPVTQPTYASFADLQLDNARMIRRFVHKFMDLTEAS